MDILQISNLLKPEMIITLNATTKNEALQEMMIIVEQSELITDKSAFRKKIKEREVLMSTGIGYEIAIPHARDESIKDFVIALGISKKGISYESIDDEPVKLIFMIAASNKQNNEYIKLLSKIVLRLKNDKLKQKIINAKDCNEVYNIIKNTK